MFKTIKSRYQQELEILEARLEEVKLARSTANSLFLSNQEQSILRQIEVLQSDHNE